MSCSRVLSVSLSALSVEMLFNAETAEGHAEAAEFLDVMACDLRYKLPRCAEISLDSVLSNQIQSWRLQQPEVTR